jgi:hypothetical protein
MPDAHAIAGVVYLGRDWLMYADPALRFNLSQSVAPALVLGPDNAPATLTLRDGGEVRSSAFLHAGGAWSCMSGSSAMAFLYADPLSAVGAGLQRCALAGVVPWPDAGLMRRHGVALAALCSAGVPAAQVGRWVAAGRLARTPAPAGRGACRSGGRGR